MRKQILIDFSIKVHSNFLEVRKSIFQKTFD